MEDVTLYELINLIERGTRVHIGVVFLGDHEVGLCDLPDRHTIHSSAVCESFKSTVGGLSRCMKCRNLALRRAIRDMKPHSGLCINGVFEYTLPVVKSGEVIAVIFIGNILTEDGRKKLLEKGAPESVFETMATDFSLRDCEVAVRLIESYVIMLADKHPRQRDPKLTLIDNVKSYVLANLEYDHRLSEIASLFFYNEVYLGRLFREMTGEGFKDFLNRERIDRALGLLSEGMTVTEVAERVGYNSVTYFNRVFKATTGMTPSEYRQNKT